MGLASEKGFGNGGELLRRSGTVETKWPAILSSWFGDLRGADRRRVRKGDG